MATVTARIESDQHAIVVRGGHSLYCVQCDRDVATLNRAPRGRVIVYAETFVGHEASIRRLLNPALLPVIR